MESIIISTPWIDCESPYTIACNARICGDNMILKFIGDGARSHSTAIRSLRTGDVVAITGRARRGEILVEAIIVINGTFVGRNLNTYM